MRGRKGFVRLEEPSHPVGSFQGRLKEDGGGIGSKDRQIVTGGHEI